MLPSAKFFFNNCPVGHPYSQALIPFASELSFQQNICHCESFQSAQ